MRKAILSLPFSVPPSLSPFVSQSLRLFVPPSLRLFVTSSLRLLVSYSLSLLILPSPFSTTEFTELHGLTLSSISTLYALHSSLSPFVSQSISSSLSPSVSPSLSPLVSPSLSLPISPSLNYSTPTGFALRGWFHCYRDITPDGG